MPNVQSIHSSLTYLTRLAQRSPEAQTWLDQALAGRLSAVLDAAIDVAIGTGDPIGKLLAAHLARCDDPAMLEHAFARCEEGATLYSIPLLELSEIIDRRLIELGGHSSLSEVEHKIRIPWLHLNLGNHLSAQGEHFDAVAHTRKAVRMFRDLASHEPDTYLPHLAQALHNLGMALLELSCCGEALEVLQESVEIQRRSLLDSSDLFRALLASSLDGLGICLHAVGRSAEAAEVMEEGIELQQRVPRESLEPLPYTASRLNLGLALGSLGRHEEALHWTEEAVDLCRELANDRPDAFTPQLALGLQNLSRLWAALGRREEALACAQEATVLYGGLATERPRPFIASYAKSLSHYGLLVAEEDVTDGVEFCEEAVRILRDLARQRKGIYDLDLAQALGNLGAARSLDDREPAKTELIFRRALRILRRIGRENPERYHYDLAKALQNLASCVSLQGRERAAIRLTRERVVLYRRLVSKDPTLYTPFLAASLRRLGMRLERIDSPGTALRAYKEAVQLYRGVSRRDSDPIVLAGFASTLRSLRELLRRRGLQGQAKAVQRELSALRRRKKFPRFSAFDN